MIPDTEAPVADHVEIRWHPDFRVINQKEVSILTYGSDNVALKNANLYYWDPNEGTLIDS